MKRDVLIGEYFENIVAIQRKMGTKISKDLPTRAQACILSALAHQDALSLKDLASKLCTSSPAVTQLIDTLEQEGLIVRKEAPDDRRKLSLSLSAKGKKIHEQAKKERMEAFGSLLKALTDEELTQLMTLQRKMLHSLNRS